ncbi:MAG: alpha/beta fold hydrolase [Elusimicrobia bacterium]|nr:alpha/beta fold hydrolase [Elusimicrobiota bacterium]
MLLLHGFPQDSHCWRAVAPHLAGRFRVAVPDLRGYGGSDKPAAVRDYRTERLEADVIALMEAEGARRAHVVGHDWGGGIAYSLALNHSGRVDKLAILSCPHPQMFAPALLRDPLQILRSWYVAFFQLPWLPERVLSLGAPWLLGGAFRKARRPGAITEEDIAHYVSAIQAPGAARAGLNYYRAAVSLSELAKRGGEPRRIAAPTLILWGEQDAYLGTSLLDGVERYFETPPRVVRIPDCSHWIPEERPELVAGELLAFLS